MNQGKLEGYLIKISKGSWVTVRNRRYFALRVNKGFLVYYDKKPTEFNQIPKKIIPTKSILSVKKVKSKDEKMFEIKTTECSFILKAYNKSDREAWFMSLTGVLKQNKKYQIENIHSKRKPNGSQSIESDMFNKRKRSNKFVSANPKINMSVLMKIQTDTTSTFETDRFRFESSNSSAKNFKKKLIETVIKRDLFFNDEFKKIDITEKNMRVFECELSKYQLDDYDVAKNFGSLFHILELQFYSYKLLWKSCIIY